MIIRTALVLSASGLAFLPGMALAQSTLSYDTGQYEYAQPKAELDNDVVTETVTQSAAPDVVFVESPTIQQIDPSAPGYPAAATADAPLPAARTIPARASAQATTVAAVPQAQPGYVYVQQPPQVLYVYAAPAVYGQPVAYAQPSAGASRVIYRDGTVPAVQPVQQVQYGYGYQPGQVSTQLYLPAGAQVVAFDRSAWLDQCRARLDTYDSDSDRGEVIGALLGAAAGGVLGNRIAGSGHRTAGTLIGAGTGALAGMAVGDAIEDGGRRRSGTYGQCEAYLDDYMRQAQANAGQVQYSQPGQYMLLPVTVAMPQRAVYSDGTPAN